MGVQLNIEMNSKIRSDIKLVSTVSDDHVINVVFSRGTISFIGSTRTAFCYCSSPIESDLVYNIRLEDSVLLTMMGCDILQFDLTTTSVILTSYTKEQKALRRVRVTYTNDSLLNYQLQTYETIIKKLQRPFPSKMFLDLEQFERVCKVNDKGERGVIIKDGLFYTCGEDFKFFGITECDYNCFLMADDLTTLNAFITRGAKSIYEQDGFIVASDNTNCYLGIRETIPKDSVMDALGILDTEPNFRMKASLGNLKGLIKPIRSPKLKKSALTLLPKENTAVVAVGQTVYQLPFDMQVISGNPEEQVVIGLGTFNKLLQTYNKADDVEISVYTPIIVITYKETILMVRRQIL